MKKTTLISLLSAAALGLGFSSSATAGAVASSIIQILGLQILDSNGNQILTSDLTILNFNNTSNTQADLNESGLSDSGSASTSGNIDLYSCVGDCVAAPADNSFTTSYPPFATAYAVSDSELTGSILTPGGANASLLNEVNLGVEEDGSGQANVGVTAAFTFQYNGANTNITVDFTAIASLYAELSSDVKIPGSSADADYTWEIKIQDLTNGGDFLVWNPDGTQNNNITGGSENADSVNLQDSVSSLLPGFIDSDGGSGFMSATSANQLISGNQYQLIITHTSTADATLIAEPSALALLGAGLLALGFAGKRRKIRVS